MIKNGKREGEWVFYSDSGWLYKKGTYRNGLREGEWVKVYLDHTDDKMKFKNGRPWEGTWKSWNFDMSIDKSETGTFKNGKKISD